MGNQSFLVEEELSLAAQMELLPRGEAFGGLGSTAAGSDQRRCAASAPGRERGQDGRYEKMG